MITLVQTTTRTEPETFGLFPRAKEYYRLKLENKDGLYTEYCPWLNMYRNKAMWDTADEKNDMHRGAKFTHQVLSTIPVDIAPYELFATYGLVHHTEEQMNSVEAYPWVNFPLNYATHNHISLNFKRVLKVGISGLMKEIDDRAAKLDQNSTDPDVIRKIDFYKYTKMSLEAVLMYAKRYRDEALRLLENESDETRRFELQRIADTLDKVPFEPAETLFEAIQSLSIYFFAVRLVTREWISTGRIDYFLDEYYRRDLELGIITQADAAEWLQMLRLKSQLLTGQSDSYALAGSNPDGTPFWSDLTYFILDATKELSLKGPQLWFRYAQGQPRSLLRKSLESIRAGAAQPGFFNDMVAVPAMVRGGFSKEHAYDYVACQCVELSSQGRGSNLSAYYYRNYLKLIEIMINDGKEIVEDTSRHAWNVKQIPEGLKTDYETFQDFLDTFEEFTRANLRECVRTTNEVLATKTELNLTISSALLDGCIENGRCALEGGALYNQCFPNFVGTITAADALAAIRQYVFEEKKGTIEDLAKMCSENFEGNESTRQYLLNRCPKYGNGDESVDKLAKWIINITDDELRKHKNIFGGIYAAEQFGFTSVNEHAFTHAASPDGRLYGEAPSGTLGGDMGRDRTGMTALFNSITSLDHTMAPGGVNVNFRISQSIMDKDDDLEKMIDMLQTYFHNGGMEIQINCVSKDKLIDAQKHPEKYRDLCIRVSGQSLYFVDLGLALQNQIINRFAHSV